MVEGEELKDRETRQLKTFFDKETEVLIAYLFGSHASGDQTAESDVDIAVLLSTSHKVLDLDYYLHLVNELSKLLGGDVDLIILNMAPPLLKHQVIKNGVVVYCRDEKTRIEFEARAEDEYLDFKRVMERYDECFMKMVLA
ncbi:MAG: nucleotidyltransferase domain-containing protein [Candidatus Caldarchaeum sp.]